MESVVVRGGHVLWDIADGADMFFLSSHPFCRMLVSDAKERAKTRRGPIRRHFHVPVLSVVTASSTVDGRRWPDGGSDRCAHLGRANYWK